MMSKKMRLSLLLIVVWIAHVSSVTEEDEGVKYANRCEGKV